MQRVERRYLLLGGCNHIPIVLLRSYFMSSKLGQKEGVDRNVSQPEPRGRRTKAMFGARHCN